MKKSGLVKNTALITTSFSIWPDITNMILMSLMIIVAYAVERAVTWVKRFIDRKIKIRACDNCKYFTNSKCDLVYLGETLGPCESYFSKK